METETGTDPQEIVARAREWIGTPYHHQASLKGVGCDCLGMLLGVYREVHGREAEKPPPYSPDWAEATGRETMYEGLKRHLREISPAQVRAGDVLVFRMLPGAPAKHCAIVGEMGSGELTLIHARQNKQVSEEAYSQAWRKKAAFAFRVP